MLAAAQEVLRLWNCSHITDEETETQAGQGSKSLGSVSGELKLISIFSWRGDEEPEHTDGKWRWKQKQSTNVPPFWSCWSFLSWSLSHRHIPSPRLTSSQTKGEPFCLKWFFFVRDWIEDCLLSVLSCKSKWCALFPINYWNNDNTRFLFNFSYSNNLEWSFLTWAIFRNNEECSFLLSLPLLLNQTSSLLYFLR